MSRPVSSSVFPQPVLCIASPPKEDGAEEIREGEAAASGLQIYVQAIFHPVSSQKLKMVSQLSSNWREDRKKKIISQFAKLQPLFNHPECQVFVQAKDVMNNRISFKLAVSYQITAMMQILSKLLDQDINAKFSDRNVHFLLDALISDLPSKKLKDEFQIYRDVLYTFCRQTIMGNSFFPFDQLFPPNSQKKQIKPSEKESIQETEQKILKNIKGLILLLKKMGMVIPEAKFISSTDFLDLCSKALLQFFLQKTNIHNDQFEIIFDMALKHKEGIFWLEPFAECLPEDLKKEFHEYRNRIIWLWQSRNIFLRTEIPYEYVDFKPDEVPANSGEAQENDPLKKKILKMAVSILSFLFAKEYFLFNERIEVYSIPQLTLNGTYALFKFIKFEGLSKLSQEMLRELDRYTKEKKLPLRSFFDRFIQCLPSPQQQKEFNKYLSIVLWLSHQGERPTCNVSLKELGIKNFGNVEDFPEWLSTVDTRLNKKQKEVADEKGAIFDEQVPSVKSKKQLPPQ